ncbi:MAG: hypothetical protein DRN15_03290 [Thermoprotei archaeon]|nr:MAG: hypothetical protein DRN15_03290 [Thermoprotei archaeon]RLF24477.1 MAG: hypothetical protein DRM97_03390 [Thermoprotei archaeon]
MLSHIVKLARGNKFLVLAIHSIGVHLHRMLPSACFSFIISSVGGLTPHRRSEIVVLISHQLDEHSSLMKSHPPA